MILQGILWLISRPFGLNLFKNIAQNTAANEQDEILRGAIEMHDKAVTSTDEKQMLHSILDLDNIDASNVMTHRRDVEILDLTQPATEILDQVMASSFSRFPLIDGKHEEIIALVHAKHLMSEYRRCKGRISRKDILRIATKPWFVPDNTSLKEQLKSFQERREHCSIVVDEYGMFLGIITLEDILEEIVGNIDDESDNQSVGTKHKDGYYIVEGSVPIRDLNRDLGWVLPDNHAVTIAGLVMHEARTLPQKDQIFSFHGYRFKILKMEKTRIASIHITPPLSESL